MKSNGAKIDFTDTSKVRCPEIGLTFPQLFRVTSYECDFSADRSKPVATDRPAPVCYTLGHPTIWKRHANSSFTPIDAPDPSIDQGWLVIRHHRSGEEEEGYTSAIIDLEGVSDERDCSVSPEYRKGKQIFTLIHRPATPGKPSPAIIYCAQIPHELIGWDDWGVVVAAEGVKITFDDLCSIE